MIATLGRWEIRTGPVQHLAPDTNPKLRHETARLDLPATEPELEQTAADFIARQVLEKDADFFGG